MHATVTTLITTSLDLDSMEPSHHVEIEDVDGLSEVSPDLIGSLIWGALTAARNSIEENYPSVKARIDKRAADGTDEDEES